MAHGAHIGGFVAGLAAAWIMDRRRGLGAQGVYAVEDAAASPTAPVDGIGGRRRLAEADMARVAAAYFKLPADQTRRALPADDSLALGNWLAREGHTDAAHVVFRRHLRDYPAGPTAAAAHVGLGLVQLEHRGEVAPAYQHFLEALDLDPDAGHGSPGPGRPGPDRRPPEIQHRPAPAEHEALGPDTGRLAPIHSPGIRHPVV